MNEERRTNHAARAALMRLRLAERRVSELLSSDARGIYASSELSAAIEGVSEILRKPATAHDQNMVLDQMVLAQMLAEHQSVIAKRLFGNTGGLDE